MRQDLLNFWYMFIPSKNQFDFEIEFLGEVRLPNCAFFILHKL